MRDATMAVSVQSSFAKLRRSLCATAGAFDPRQNLDIVPVKYRAVSACPYPGRFEKPLKPVKF